MGPRSGLETLLDATSDGSRLMVLYPMLWPVPIATVPQWDQNPYLCIDEHKYHIKNQLHKDISIRLISKHRPPRRVY